MYEHIVSVLITFLLIAGMIAGLILGVFWFYRKKLRDQKNYERGLKMVPVMIHLPPASEDVDGGSRDARDVVDEVVSQAQTMYNIIVSTTTRGFKSRIYGQRHISFEIVAHEGLVHYYVVVPTVILENIKQAVVAAYPTARLEEVEELNLFSKVGKVGGTIGGEFSLTKPYEFPIATYKETKRDAMGAILNAMAMAKQGDGMGVQILMRPAKSGWRTKLDKRVKNIREGKQGAATGGLTGPDLSYFGQMFEALWRPPNFKEDEKDKTPISGADQAKAEAMEEKAKYSGYETLIRVVASSSNADRSQTLLAGLVSAFALFTSPTQNSLRFRPANNMEDFITSYIMRFFPQEINSNILNTVELASIFHLPDQTSLPSTQVERQQFKEVDGPSKPMESGLLIGYNTYRGRKKTIRITDNDRRRHIYVMGSTGMGKSVFLENLAYQDIVGGRGFCFIDPHGDSAEKLLTLIPKERLNDVIYFDPADMDNPIGLNLFEIDPNDPDPERTKDYIVAETMNMLYSLYDPNRQGIVGPRMANIVRYAALLLMSAPGGGTFMDIPKILVDPDFAKSKIPYLTNQRAIDFWTKEWPNAQKSNDAGDLTSWVVSKWADFENTMMTNILGQAKSSLNLREVMDKQKILLVNLSKGKLGEAPAKLLGMVFVMKFQAAAMSRANIPESERKDFCLFADEFQNFATDSFESILSEARKYRLNLVIAHQFMGQLIDKIRGAVKGNVGAYIIGRVGTDDVEDIVKMFQPVFSTEDLLYMPNYVAAVKMLVDGAPAAPFSMNLPLPMGQPNKKLGEALRKLSAAKYGKPRAQVEAEIKKRQGEGVKKTATQTVSSVNGKPAKPQKSFLDDWLSKRTSSSKPAKQPSTNMQAVSKIGSTPRPNFDQQSNITSPTSQIAQNTNLIQPQPIAPLVQPKAEPSQSSANLATQTPTQPEYRSIQPASSDGDITVDLRH